MCTYPTPKIRRRDFVCTYFIRKICHRVFVCTYFNGWTQNLCKKVLFLFGIADYYLYLCHPKMNKLLMQRARPFLNRK